MEKSIPLKEIVGFLPYELNIKTNNLIRKMVIETSDLVYVHQLTRDKQISISNVINGIGHKPIVRPLSDITKEITHNGETIKPYEILFPVDEFDKLMDWTSLKCAKEFLSHEQRLELSYPMEFWEKIKELNFDIYDWIKDGKAIDINTL